MNLNRLTPREREHFLFRVIGRKQGGFDAEVRSDLAERAHDEAGTGPYDTITARYYSDLLNDAPASEAVG